MVRFGCLAAGGVKEFRARGVVNGIAQNSDRHVPRGAGFVETGWLVVCVCSDLDLNRAIWADLLGDLRG